MRKLIILLAILLCAALHYPQAAVDIQLIISDQINPNMSIYLGLDLTATNGIDTHLGEVDLYGLYPPPGIFEGRFDLTPYAGNNLHSYRDYRNAPSFPYTGEKQHRLIWELGYLGSFLNINYNLPVYASMQIQDEFGGFLVNSPDLTGTGTFIITPPIGAVRLNITYTNALPVELTSFSGIQEGSAIKLSWTTASETNNKGFELERKIQHSIWETISFIEGHGTTAEIQSYSYTDNLRDINNSCPIFYRLRQIDYDGTTTYSDELKIEFHSSPGHFALLQNYPNPFNPATIISYSIPQNSKVIIKVFDILGNEIETLVDEEKPAGRYETTWNAANQPGGAYFYQITAGNYIETRKMILLR